jgi:SAM-dependent methyltransferase
MQDKNFEYKSWTDDSVFPSVDAPFFLDHVSRYYHACGFLDGNDSVLDVACGKGYGSAVLARNAGSVLGVDLNEDSLELARKSFPAKNLAFRSQDVLKLEELGRRFKLITAFEIIEHLDPSDTDRFLTGLKNCLEPGGLLLLSTPNHEVVLKAGVEVPPFHINNLSSTELSMLLRRHFPVVQMYGQYRARGTVKDLAFHLDYFSLRHRVRAMGRALRSEEKAVVAASRSERIWTPERMPKEVGEYRFSRWAWKQAGLTFAVCANGVA